MGRVVLSLIAISFVYYLFVWNAPEGEVRDVLRDPIKETVWAAGIGQDWGVFAPNPVNTSYRVEADITFADGSIERYKFPDGEPVVGAYREFRWRKYESRIRRDDNRRYLRPTALWIREQYAEQDVVTVVLYRRTRRVPEPGSGQVREWEEEEIFSLRFAESVS